MQIVTVLVKVRIVNALWMGLKLLQRISMAKVEERVDTLKLYRENYLEDLYEKSKVMIESGGNKTKMITMPKDSHAIPDDMPSVSMEIMETTSRDFQATAREK